MSKPKLNIQIEEPYVDLITKEQFKRAVKLTLGTAGISSTVELGLVIAGDDTVHKLNRSYRGVDDTTDVLAFALSESSSEGGEPFVSPPDEIMHLGEVIISYPQAKRQAEEQRHSIGRELALLVAHGVLHLLGYDHEHPEDEQRMRALEAKVLDAMQDDA